jgi:hypothetical protein
MICRQSFYQSNKMPPSIAGGFNGNWLGRASAEPTVVAFDAGPSHRSWVTLNGSNYFMLSCGTVQLKWVGREDFTECLFVRGLSDHI